jgi:hypothetical protein
LFSQVPKLGFSIFGPARLLPELIRSRLDFLYAGFGHGGSPKLKHGPTFQAWWGLIGGTVLGQLEDWPTGFNSP